MKKLMTVIAVFGLFLFLGIQTYAANQYVGAIRISNQDLDTTDDVTFASIKTGIVELSTANASFQGGAINTSTITVAMDGFIVNRTTFNCTYYLPWITSANSETSYTIINSTVQMNDNTTTATPTITLTPAGGQLIGGASTDASLATLGESISIKAFVDSNGKGMWLTFGDKD